MVCHYEVTYVFACPACARTAVDNYLEQVSSGEFKPLGVWSAEDSNDDRSDKVEDQVSSGHGDSNGYSPATF